MPTSTEERLKRVTIGEPIVLTGPIALAESNPEWPKQFARHAERIQAALGERALRIEHVGSTSVPGLEEGRSFVIPPGDGRILVRKSN